MSHIRKLRLNGNVCGRDQKVSAYYSWPMLEKQGVVEDIIKAFKKAFCNVTVVIEHNLEI